MALKVTAVAHDADLLALPWDVPLEDWPSRLQVELPRGISRHVVRFVRVNGVVYAVKEVGQWSAEREYRLLRALVRRQVPQVEAVAVLTGREAPDGTPLEPAVVTRHLRYAVPYRLLLSGQVRTVTLSRVLDALAVLLVRLHLAGFAWGDCSLSNTLFRRDAGAFAAYLVDAETGELHDRLTDGQRHYDLECARMNIIGELMDLEAGGELQTTLDPFEIGETIAYRYLLLWAELTGPEVFDAREQYRIEARIARLNDLGFDVAELDIAVVDGQQRLRIQPKVVDAGHHSRRLLRLTGLDVRENQARRLLNDLDRYRIWKGLQDEDEEIAAHDWLTNVFEFVVRQVPRELCGRLEPAEVFHEVLEHRWFLSERAGHDVGNEEAARRYVTEVLPAESPGQAGVPLSPAVTAAMHASWEPYPEERPSAGSRRFSARR